MILCCKQAVLFLTGKGYYLYALISGIALSLVMIVGWFVAILYMSFKFFPMISDLATEVHARSFMEFFSSISVITGFFTVYGRYSQIKHYKIKSSLNYFATYIAYLFFFLSLQIFMFPDNVFENVHTLLAFSFFFLASFYSIIEAAYTIILHITTKFLMFFVMFFVRITLSLMFLGVLVYQIIVHFYRLTENYQRMTNSTLLSDVARVKFIENSRSITEWVMVSGFCLWIALFFIELCPYWNPFLYEKVRRIEHDNV